MSSEKELNQLEQLGLYSLKTNLLKLSEGLINDYKRLSFFGRNNLIAASNEKVVADLEAVIESLSKAFPPRVPSGK